MASLNRFQTGSQWNQRLGPNDNAKEALLCDFLSLKHYMKVTCSHFKHSTSTIQHITAASLIERRDLPADTLFKLKKKKKKRQTHMFHYKYYIYQYSLHHITCYLFIYVVNFWSILIFIHKKNFYLHFGAQIQLISAFLIKKYIAIYYKACL